MHDRLLVIVSLLSPSVFATYVVNVDDYWKEFTANISPRENKFDVKGFLNDYGYPFQAHEVTTEDGYVLGLHRIPHGKNEAVNGTEDKAKPAVLIMHGLMSSSVDFFILGPEKSVALILADLGYDVWLGNNRGNKWSRKHVILDPDSNATFWDFSFHELGYYDVSAMIDYILKKTGNKKVTYIGHSQGSTQFFAMASTRPEYNEKVTVMAALAPPIYMKNLTSPLARLLAENLGIIEYLIDRYTLTEIIGYSSTLSSILEAFCDDDSDYQEVCITFLFFIVGFDGEQIDRSTFSSLFENLPAGASARQFVHYLQEINSGHFRPYDYGETKNLDIYNSSTPPDYNLTAVTAPVALYYSENDLLASVNDVEKLAKALPNVAQKHLIGFRRFSHYDYLIAKDVYSLLYFYVINLINEYNGFDPVLSTTTTISSITTTKQTTTSIPKTTPGSASIPSNSMQGLYGLILLIVIKLLV